MHSPLSLSVNRCPDISIAEVRQSYRIPKDHVSRSSTDFNPLAAFLFYEPWMMYNNVNGDAPWQYIKGNVQLIEEDE